MDAISCLAPLAATSFADAALARALHFSMSDHSSASSSSTNHHHYSYSPLLLCADDQLASTYAPVTCDSVLVASSDYSPRRSSSSTGGGRRLAPAAGARAAGKKRRSRASKRAPTTYISTDPSNFRLMVQQVTGVQAEPAVSLAADPTAFDASVLLLQADTNPLLTGPGDHHQHQQQQQPCFPTLDSSWNVVSMYERNE